MSDFNNGFRAVPDGFRAVSADELAQVEGGKGFWSKVKWVGDKLLGAALVYVALRQIR